MLLDGAGEIVEMFRNSFPLSFLFFVPILILISPVSTAHDFGVYRMQQFDLQGVPHGSRNALVNVEARPVTAAVFTRKCIIAKLKELTIDKYKEMVQQSAGGLLILLPTQIDDLNKEEQEHLMELEQDLMEEESQTPVYFTYETPELNVIYDDIKRFSNSDSAESAFEVLMGSVTSNGFQLQVAGPQSKALNDFQIVNIQGKLAGYGIEEQLPTIMIVAHYDSYGVAPSLSFGADSNGSGVVALLELARLFSKLYTNSRNHAKYNLMFLLSGAGKFSYQGTKRWLDDQFESGETSQLGDVAFVICLDTIGKGDTLNIHVSKPPKEGSPVDVFVKNLEILVNETQPERQVKMIHKKINLAEEFLAWEHERFSIRRMPALTVSRLDSNKSPQRNTILDTRNTVDINVLSANVKVLAEAIACQIYNLTTREGAELFTDGLKIDEGLINSWMDYLSSRPRAAQWLTKDSPELANLQQAMTRHLKDVKRHTFKADKRDPECIFYSGTDFTMNAYSVKPAIFDLFLGLAIAAYLAVLYLVTQNFHDVYAFVKRLNTSNGVGAKKVL